MFIVSNVTNNIEIRIHVMPHPILWKRICQLNKTYITKIFSTCHVQNFDEKRSAIDIINVLKLNVGTIIERDILPLNIYYINIATSFSSNWNH